MDNQKFTAVLHKEEDMWIADCLEVGTVSQGKTIEGALDNLKEATELHLEEFPIKSEASPVMTVFEVKNGKVAQSIRA
jgi:predicted RNase H-like HicB family nuclease|tara:strand:+ start:563 stop:796 length:234 start_codon:yes stop_codon:yes gene_type:complete